MAKRKATGFRPDGQVNRASFRRMMKAQEKAEKTAKKKAAEDQ